MYDGDTCTVAMCVGGADDDCPRSFKVRLAGIDTPEMRGGSPEEKRAAVQCRDALRSMVLDRLVWLDVVPKADKYGRLLATLWAPQPDPECRSATPADGEPTPGPLWTNVNERMLSTPGTRAYDGGTKTGFVLAV